MLPFFLLPAFFFFLILFPSVVPAREYVAGKIAVSGNFRTRDFTVKRVMTFESGDVLDSASLESTIKINHDNIYNLGIFNDVEIKDSMAGDSIHFRIAVSERWYIFPISYVAFEERNFNEWWADKDLDRLVAGLGVNWKNVTGRAEDFYLYGQLGYSRRFSVNYDRPFLFPAAKIDGEFFYRFTSRKEIGYGTANGVLQLARLTGERIQTSQVISASLKKRLSPRINITVGFNWQYFLPHDSVRILNDRYLTTSSGAETYPSFFIQYVNDQRDIQTYPLKGYRISIFARQSGSPWIGTASFLKASIFLAHHIPLGGKWFNFAWGMQDFILLGTRVPFFDKNILGFENFVRGYERYVIDGSLVHVSKTEFKAAIIPRRIVHMEKVPFRQFQDFPVGLYITLFADAGIVIDNTFSNSDQYLKNRLLAGGGFGLNFITIYDALLRLEYSFNNLGESGFFLSTRIPIR